MNSIIQANNAGNKLRNTSIPTGPIGPPHNIPPNHQRPSSTSPSVYHLPDSSTLGGGVGGGGATASQAAGSRPSTSNSNMTLMSSMQNSHGKHWFC